MHYVDDEMFVAIYKNHFLLLFLGGLEVYDITKANRVYHYQVTHKYGVTTNIDSFLIFLYQMTNHTVVKKTKIAIMWGRNRWLLTTILQTGNLAQEFF